MKLTTKRAARVMVGLAFVALTMPAPAASRALPAAPAVTLLVEAGFSGYVRPLTWMPIRVTASNGGDAVEGALVMDSSTADGARHLTVAVPLPRGARKQVFLYGPSDVRSPVVRYVAGGVDLASASIGTRSIAPEDRLVIVASDPPDGFNFLADIRTPYGGRTYVAPMRIEQLPDHSAALDGVDAILFNNVDSAALSADQRAALQAWIVAGGHVILSGGPGARLAAGGFTDILPASASGAIAQRSVAPLAAFAASRSLTTVVAIAADALAPLDLPRLIRDGIVLVGSPEAPLVVRRDLGRGMLDQLAFDASLAPIRDWRDRTGVFAALFGGRVEAVADFSQVRSEVAAVTGASALPATSLPPFGVVAAFLLAYAMTVGPINFLTLRRFNRMRWAWVTVPMIVLAFTGLGIALGFRLRGNNPVLHRASVIYADNRVAAARSQGLVGVFSPRQTTLSVDFGRALPQLAASPPSATSRAAEAGPALDLNFGAVSRVSDLRIASASVKSFVTRGEIQASLVSANAQFLMDESPPRLALALRNDSEGDFQDCVASIGRNFTTIGAFPPGKVAQVPVLLRSGEPHMRQYGLGLTYGYGLGAGSAFVRTGARNGPFDTSGGNMTDMALTWRKFDRAELREEADRGLINTFFSGTSRGGEGALLMCWELRERAPAEVEGATYVDRGLRIWRLGLPAYRPAAGQALPSELFEWALSASSSTVSWTSDGLQLSPGAHLLAFRPWADVRFGGPAISATLRTEFSTGSLGSVLAQSTVSIFNWTTNRYAPIRRGLAQRGPGTLAPVSGDFISPAGEMIVRFDIIGDAVTLSDIDLGDLSLR